MAIKDAVETKNADGTYLVVWENITESDTGASVMLARYPDKTIQVVGDFGSNSAITIEGSNDGNTWGTLHDTFGNDLVLSDSNPKTILENTVYIRPSATAGSGVDVNVYVVATPRGA